MNIAWFTPEIPYPPVGGRNGVFNRIKQLSKYCNIYLFSIAYSEEEKESSKDMLPYCKEVNYYNRNNNKLLTLLKSLVAPFSVASRSIKELQSDFVKLLQRIDIDVVIVDFPNMAKNIQKIFRKHSDLTGNIYFTLNQHNIEYLRMREMVNVKTIPFFKRVLYYLESFRLENYEKRLYRSNLFKSITFFSENDIALFQNKWKQYPGELKLFPLGANMPDEIRALDENNLNILFVGRLDEVAVPNIEAAIWFVDEVFPKIINKVSRAKFIIAGANPSSRILDLQSDNIEVIPNFANIEEIYNKVDIVVLPLKSGGGVKGKLLEAVAYKKVIVSTMHGVEGTLFGKENDVLVSDDCDEFASYCIDILEHKLSYNDNIEKAFELFKNHYDWNKICCDYYNYLNDSKE